MSTHFVAGGNGDLSESQGKHSGDPPMEGYGEVRFIEVEGETQRPALDSAPTTVSKVQLCGPRMPDLHGC